MIDAATAGVLWKSRRGFECNENNDVGILVKGGAFSVAMIADGFGRCTQGSGYPRDFLRLIARHLHAAIDPGIDQCVGYVRMAHADLRRQYAGHRFCFALLLLRDQAGETWSIHCGDCRVATTEGGRVKRWETEVHSAAVPHGESFDASCVDDERRYIVTRSVGIRSPELCITRIDADPGSGFVLATDGYWTRQITGLLEQPSADDSSVLLITNAPGPDTLESDCDNFLVLSV